MNPLEQFKQYCDSIGCIALVGESMRSHTTFRIGGPADLFVRPRDRDQAVAVVKKAREFYIPVTVIGKGSNLLVSDGGLRGIVLSMDEKTANPPKVLNETLIRCPAGASMASLCVFAMKNSLTGLEFAWGIPGSVGGAVCMNAGAYGGDISHVLYRVEYIDLQGNIKEAAAEELELGYRKSWFTRHPGYIITNTVFALSRGSASEIRSAMEEIMEKRKQKQPLDYPSAGSVFKRPAGAFAGELIEQCGLKGRRIGGAMVSQKHAGFIVNYDNATCTDVKTLIEEVRRTVRFQTGYVLEQEIKDLP